MMVFEVLIRMVPASIGDCYSLSPLIIDKYLKVSNVIGGNGFMNSDTIYQQDWGLNNGHVSCVNGFINSYTVSQCDYSSTFK